MKSSDLIKDKNILITPADHKRATLIPSTGLIGAFWDSVRKANTIIYDAGYALYFTLDPDINRVQSYDQSGFSEMRREFVSRFPGAVMGGTTADQIELPLYFGFNVILFNYEKWFDYEKYFSDHYGS